MFNSVFSQEAQERNYATFDSFLSEQKEKIAQIEIGDTGDEVKTIMGSSFIVRVPKIGKMKPLNQLFKQPEFSNEYKNGDEKTISIWYYFSNPRDENGVITKSECTPVVFENEKVLGLGWVFLKKYKLTHRKLFLRRTK